MGFFNPFNEIFENNQFIHSRTLRTGFWQKMSDTFFVFSGSFYAERRKHIGLFDYLTLGIPLGIADLCGRIISSKSYAALILYIPAGLIWAVLTGIRYSAAAIFTLAVSPLVLITHGLSIAIKGNELQGQAKSLFTKGPYLFAFDYAEDMTLGKYLSMNANSLEDIEVDFVGTHRKFQLQLHKASSKTYVCFHPSCTGGKHISRIIEINLDEDNKPSKAAFKALLELNVGGLSRKLERRGFDFSFFRSEGIAVNTLDDKKQINTRLPAPKRHN